MKKVWLWCGIIVGIIIVLIILVFTLFTLKSVEVKFHNSTDMYSSQEVQQEIINSADFKFGKTVFSHNKAEYSNTLEKKYPYLRVINIETSFPNKFIIHCEQREPLFATLFDGGYYICDASMKILEVMHSPYESTQQNCIKLITISTLPVDLQAGDFLAINEVNILKNISSSFERCNRNIAEQKVLIKEIKVIKDNYNPRHPLDETLGLELYDFAGIKCVIVGADERLAEKINYFLTYQTQMLSPLDHYLLIWENRDKVIEVIEKAI